MKTQFNDWHLRFCRAHDWGRNARIEKDRIVDLIDEWTDENKILHRAKISFDDFDLLLQWAGY